MGLAFEAIGRISIARRRLVERRRPGRLAGTDLRGEYHAVENRGASSTSRSNGGASDLPQSGLEQLFRDPDSGASTGHSMLTHETLARRCSGSAR